MKDPFMLWNIVSIGQQTRFLIKISRKMVVAEEAEFTQWDGQELADSDEPGQSPCIMLLLVTLRPERVEDGVVAAGEGAS